MKKFVIATVLISSAALVSGCNILGGQCKFNKGQIAGGLSADVKAFMDTALELKKATDDLEARWNVELKAMAEELKAGSPDDMGVLAKLNANMKEVRAKGECDVDFKADIEAKASGSAEASGEADSSKGVSGSGLTTGTASADVHVDINLKCKAEAKVEAMANVTTKSIQAHYPKLLGIVVGYRNLGPKIKEAVELGTKVMGTIVKKDPLLVPEVKCAVEAMTGIKVEARVSFSVKASAAARGEMNASS